MSKKKYINADVLFCFYKQVDELQYSPDKISKIKARFLKNNVITTIQDYNVKIVPYLRAGAMKAIAEKRVRYLVMRGIANFSMRINTVKL